MTRISSHEIADSTTHSALMPSIIFYRMFNIYFLFTCHFLSLWDASGLSVASLPRRTRKDA